MHELWTDITCNKKFFPRMSRNCLTSKPKALHNLLAFEVDCCCCCCLSIVYSFQHVKIKFPLFFPYSFYQVSIYCSSLPDVLMETDDLSFS